MTHQYHIDGMSCMSCVAKVKSELLKLGDVEQAEVQLAAPQATIKMQSHISLPELEKAVRKAGNYSISASPYLHDMEMTDQKADSQTWLNTYKPILLIAVFLFGITALIEIRSNGPGWMSWMHNFMAGFFLVFAFFKLLDLKGFAENYASYDIISKRWMGWGYIYPFIELLLGIAFLTWFSPLLTNGLTFVIMSISIIGVLQTVLNKKTIRCACLGSVFNLPMSTITIIEDALMIIMSLIMFLSII